MIVSAMRKAQPQIVIVPLTGYPGFESAVEGIRQDVDDYFVKPADYEALEYHRAAWAETIATGAAVLNWSSDVSTFCQRDASLFVSIAADGSE